MGIFFQKWAVRLCGLSFGGLILCGCDTNIFRDATAVQLQGALVLLMDQLASLVIYNALGLSPPLGF